MWSLRNAFKQWLLFMELRKCGQLLVAEGVVVDERDVHLGPGMVIDEEYQHYDTDPEAYGPYERDYTDDEFEDFSYEVAYIKVRLPRVAG